MKRNIARVTAAGLIGLLAAPLTAEPVACPDPRFSTVDAGADAGAICAAAERATAQLATCNLEVPTPLVIHVVDTLEPNCLGLYHCGAQRMDIRPRAYYTALLESDYDGAFAAVSPDAFFESIIRHELAHAAIDEMPCPLERCMVGQEYIAYSMQVRFLPEPDLAAFEAVEAPDGPVSREILNPLILLMAPNVFARRAWQHLTERPDPCGFIGQIARGEVLLDRPTHY